MPGPNGPHPAEAPPGERRAGPVAAVTMAYNEPEFSRLWARHYAAELGARHCYLIDHGSTDGSTDDLGGINVVRIPRSPQDDPRRTAFLSRFCASLLSWYEAVFHVDVDEFLVADPRAHRSLACLARAERRPVLWAAGLDMVHLPGRERPLAPGLPVTRQRRWLRFSSAMCKPVLIREPVAWAPGFHSIDAEPAFGDLFLFHLRYADLGGGLARLARTRAQDWQHREAGAHQRMADAEWEAMLLAMAGLPRRPDLPLETGLDPLASWLGRVAASAAGRERETYRIDLHLSGVELWRLPARFVDRF